MLHRIIFCNNATYWQAEGQNPHNMGFASYIGTTNARQRLECRHCPIHYKNLI